MHSTSLFLVLTWLIIFLYTHWHETNTKVIPNYWYQRKTWGMRHSEGPASIRCSKQSHGVALMGQKKKKRTQNKPKWNSLLFSLLVLPWREIWRNAYGLDCCTSEPWVRASGQPRTGEWHLLVFGDGNIPQGPLETMPALKQCWSLSPSPHPI